MRTILSIFLFLALILSTTAKRDPFITLSRQLNRLRRPQICAARKNFEIELRQRQLNLAFRCLPRTERRRLRALCRTTPATEETTAACETLRACPRIRPILRDLDKLEKISCPRASRRFARVEKRWRRRLNRLIRKARLPPPVYDTIILEPRMKADSAVVILHGVGDSAINRLPLAVDLQKALPTTRFILPQAPQQFVTLFNDTRNSWFNLLGNDLEAPEATDEIIAAGNAIDAVGEVQTAVYGIPRERVGVFGISQGGGVALTTYLRHKWGAAVGVSSFLPIRSSYPAALGTGTAGVELLMLHGVQDRVVPFPFGALSRGIIRALGREVRFIELTGDHFLPFEQDIVVRETIAQLKGAFA